MTGDDMVREAWISQNGLYRYWLSRWWNLELPSMTWIMLNPSTADAEVDDPTIRRCMGFARREGCGGIEVVNLYALRTTKPTHLADHPDPEGPGNTEAWHRALADTSVVVAAWGSRASTLNVAPSKALREWYGSGDEAVCLGATSSGAPRHPLYVTKNAPFVRWLHA